MVSRRAVIKAVVSSSALIGAAVLMPRTLLAAWNRDAFEAENQQVAMRALYGKPPVPSSDVILKVPGIAADGDVVPVTVKTSLTHVESISVFVEQNPTPLVAEFLIPLGTLPEVTTRIRMARSSSITAVVKTDKALLSASLKTKVVPGGCDN